MERSSILPGGKTRWWFTVAAGRGELDFQIERMIGCNPKRLLPPFSFQTYVSLFIVSVLGAFAVEC